MHSRSSAKQRKTFQVKSHPSIGRYSGRRITKGRAPSKVPAGQMYLQKAGRANPLLSPDTRGMASTSRARTPYLHQESRRVQGLLGSLGLGMA